MYKYYNISSIKFLVPDIQTADFIFNKTLKLPSMSVENQQGSSYMLNPITALICYLPEEDSETATKHLNLYAPTEKIVELHKLLSGNISIGVTFRDIQLGSGNIAHSVQLILPNNISKISISDMGIGKKYRDPYFS